jgi:trehalose 6-phosphate phosphatase
MRNPTASLQLCVRIGNGKLPRWNLMERDGGRATSLPAPPRLRAPELALFLDVDGTLLEIAREPHAVHVPERLCRILEQLQSATGGALALVSGRSLDQIDRLFAPLRLSAAGLHGLERRNLGVKIEKAAPNHGAFERARRRLSDFAEAHDGVLLEDKGLTLALHYRKAPELADATIRAAETAVAESEGALVLLRGKMVCELKPPGVDKGRAIVAFLDEPPFARRRPVFAGDDVTDEAGFVTINQRGGVSIRIGGGQRSAAAFGLPNVTAVHTWLLELLGARAS